MVMSFSLALEHKQSIPGFPSLLPLWVADKPRSAVFFAAGSTNLVASPGRQQVSLAVVASTRPSIKVETTVLADGGAHVQIAKIPAAFLLGVTVVVGISRTVE